MESEKAVKRDWVAIKGTVFNLHCYKGICVSYSPL